MALFEDLVGGTRFGQRLRRNETDDVRLLLDQLKQIPQNQTERRDELQQLIFNSKPFQRVSGRMNTLAQRQVEKRDAITQLETSSKQIQTISQAMLSAKEAGLITEDDPGFIGSKQKVASLAGAFATKSEPTPSGITGPASAVFPNQQDAKGLSESERKTIGAIKTAPGSSKEKRAAMISAISGQRAGKSIESTLDGFNLSESEKKSAKAFIEERASSSFAAGQKIKAFEELIQVSTPDFPVDNTPKPRAALGITEPANQQTMQELEQAAPEGMDVKALVQSDPETFKLIFDSLRRGKTPSGKPFTIKDALEIMGQI